MATLGVITANSTKPIRIVQCRTGNTGAVTLQAILDAPGPELVGVWGAPGRRLDHFPAPARPHQPLMNSVN